jgi:hypothetical protein
MKAQIEELFNKEMTRKEFLQHIAGAILILFGISGIINALLGSQKRKPSVGYGASAYGGFKKG